MLLLREWQGIDVSPVVLEIHVQLLVVEDGLINFRPTERIDRRSARVRVSRSVQLLDVMDAKYLGHLVELLALVGRQHGARSVDELIVAKPPMRQYRLEGTRKLPPAVGLAGRLGLSQWAAQGVGRVVGSSGSDELSDVRGDLRL